MDYTVILNGQSYDLPKLTLSIKEKIDNVNLKISNGSIPLMERVKVQHDFMKELVGADNLEEILGTSDIKSIDLNEMSIAYVEICRSYEAPMTQKRQQAIPTETIEKMNELLKNLGNVSQIEKVMKQNGDKKSSFNAL